MRTDRNGNYIGNGSFSAKHEVFDFTRYPQVETSVSFSETTESVYVTYYNNENNNRITCRFAHHENNAVKFGDQLDGYLATELEVLYRLGLATRVFEPETYLDISKCQVKKVEIPNYEMADLKISEIYALGAGADISQYTGKIAKDSNWLILGTEIKELVRRHINAFGIPVRIGRYIYTEIN